MDGRSTANHRLTTRSFCALVFRSRTSVSWRDIYTRSAIRTTTNMASISPRRRLRSSLHPTRRVLTLLMSGWLRSASQTMILDGHPAKDWVTLTVPVSLAEKMLDTVRFRSSLSWVDSGADICASGIQRVETRPEWRIPRPNDKLQPAHSLACTYRCYPAYDHVWSGQTPKVFCQLPRSRRVRYRRRQ